MRLVIVTLTILLKYSWSDNHPITWSWLYTNNKNHNFLRIPLDLRSQLLHCPSLLFWKRNCLSEKKFPKAFNVLELGRMIWINCYFRDKNNIWNDYVPNLYEMYASESLEQNICRLQKVNDKCSNAVAQDYMYLRK